MFSQDMPVVGMWYLLSFDSNKISTPEEFLKVNGMSPGKSGVNQGVGYQNLLPFPVSAICLLHCTVL